MPFVTAAFLLALLALTGWWLLRRPSASDPEADLLRVCHGDREQAERLIRLELARAPGITRTHAARRATESRRRDNR